MLQIALMMIGLAMADENWPCDEKDKDCKPNRSVCFNIYCSYHAKDDDHGGKEHQSCEAAATFTKWITHDGKEVHDRSKHPENPELQVACDGISIFNNSAYRYTDHLGTRIQAQMGPYPAVLLPKGALRENHGYIVSSLELPKQRLRGYCYVYTGFPSPQ